MFSALTAVELSFPEMGKATSGTDLGLGTCQEFVWGPVKLEVPVTHLSGDIRHLDIVSGVARTAPRCTDCLGRFNRPWLWLMAMIYHSKKIQSTVSKGRRPIGQSV